MGRARNSDGKVAKRTSFSTAKSARARSTNKTYEREARRFCDWKMSLGETVELVDEHAPESICEYIVHRTNNMALKVGSAEQVRKALKGLYESIGHYGGWRTFKSRDECAVVQGNPTCSEEVSKFIKDYKKTKERLQEGQVTADPLMYEHWCGIFNEKIGITTKDAESDLKIIRELRIWTMTLLSANMLLRFDEVSRLRMENLEFYEEDFSKIRVILPDGSKNNPGFISYWLEGWPTCSDPRASPMVALARWLRLRGLSDGPLFCQIGSDLKLRLGVNCVSSDIMNDLQVVLKAVGVVDVSRMTTHSAKRGGAQFYEKQGMSYNWIMQKGNWTDHKAFQRYLSLNNRNTKMEFQSAMAHDVYYLLKRTRQQDVLLDRTRSLISSFQRGQIAPSQAFQGIRYLLEKPS